MRIGLAIETDSPGGAETMLIELARELQHRNHEIVAVGPTGGEGWLTERLADLGIERDLVEFSGPFGLGSVPRIASIVRRRRLDVLHSHEFAMAVCGALGARLAGCKHVVTMHGGTYFATAARRRHAFRLAKLLSKHTVAVSEAAKRVLVQSLGVDARSIEVVHNGVAPVTVSPAGIRDELGVGSDEILVLAVGNLLPVKGHPVLLRAVSRVLMNGERLVLAIAGRGPEEDELRELIDALGLSGQARLLGYRPDVRALLLAADVYVMPSLSEGLPMAMIEAMLSGTPIIASDAGGIGELIDSPELGVLVRPGDVDGLADGLFHLVRDAELRSNLGAAARARAEERFTASAMTERYLELYTD